MKPDLPEAIALFFTVSNGADTADLVRCFTGDAVVSDEGRTYRGYEAIVSWMRGTRATFDYAVEPLNVVQDGERVRVAAEVAGNFPGSPVRLDHVFGLQGGKIQSLEIR